MLAKWLSQKKLILLLPYLPHVFGFAPPFPYAEKSFLEPILCSGRYRITDLLLAGMGFSFTVDITIFLSISSNSIFSTKETKHKNKPKTQRTLECKSPRVLHLLHCFKGSLFLPIEYFTPIKLKLSFLSPNFS